MRSGALVAAAVLALAPLVAQGSDAPHNYSTIDSTNPSDPGIGCKSCHAMHIQAAGAGGLLLATQPTTYDNCQACHSSTRYSIQRTEKADPGASGNHHAFEVNATNGAHGALPPANTTLLASLQAGTNVECATCHNQHLAGQAANGALVNTSSAIGFPVSAVAGTDVGQRVAFATVFSDGTAASAAAKGYLIDIVTAGSGTTARFRVSNDGGTSWYGCSSGYTYGTYGGSFVGCAAGAAAYLNDPVGTGSKVSVAFTGTFAVGDQFRFWVSYPFLRVTNADAAMCHDCHRERVQDHICVEGGAVLDGNGVSCAPNGMRKYSHPVNVALAKSYDRAAPLDADGSAQGGGGEVPANPTNDLVLTSVGSKVTCLTCHSPHFADSNSLTNDTP